MHHQEDGKVGALSLFLRPFQQTHAHITDADEIFLVELLEQHKVTR